MIKALRMMFMLAVGNGQALPIRYNDSNFPHLAGGIVQNGDTGCVRVPVVLFA